MNDMDELTTKIKEGEILLAQERTAGWLPLVGSLLITFYLALKIPYNEVYLLLTGLALLYLGFNIWRVVKAQQNVKALEAKIRSYRDQQAKLKNPAS